MPTYDIGLEHVSLAFATKTIFTDVTQGVFEGDRIGIVGKNGDGKSTLLHLFRGAQEPDSGRVTKRGGLTFGMLDQRDPLDDNATIREAALEGIGIFLHLTSPPTISTWSLSTGLPNI